MHAVVIAIFVAVSIGSAAHAQQQQQQQQQTVRDMMNDMKARYGQTCDQCQALATSRGYILNGFDETGENRAIMMFIEGCIMGTQR
jgi:hypothetical protein